MKRNFTHKLLFLGNALVSILVLNSCSTINDLTERTAISEKEKSSKGMIPKAEYDSLLKKYEALVNDKQIQSAKTKSKSIDLNKPAILDELANAEDPALEETVDVFTKPTSNDVEISKVIGKKELTRTKPTLEVELNPDEVEKEITLLREAEELIAQNKFNEAMGNLKSIEKSPVKQIRANSKFLVGEILFKQQEYDLSMQIFEEIISKNAFSGVIIKALGRLVVCAEKLKLPEKQQRYHSLLHDFFES